MSVRDLAPYGNSEPPQEYQSSEQPEELAQDSEHLESNERSSIPMDVTEPEPLIESETGSPGTHPIRRSTRMNKGIAREKLDL